MDISKLSDADLAYVEGFVQKCAEAGVDPEQLLVKFSAGCGKKAKKGKKRFMGKKAQEEPKKKEPGAVGKAVGGAVKGTVAGAAAGGALAGAAGGAGQAMMLHKARQMPGVQAMTAGQSKGDSLKNYLSAILAGARRTAPAGAAAGGFLGGVTGAATA